MVVTLVVPYRYNEKENALVVVWSLVDVRPKKGHAAKPEATATPRMGGRSLGRTHACVHVQWRMVRNPWMEMFCRMGLEPESAKAHPDAVAFRSPDLGRVFKGRKCKAGLLGSRRGPNKQVKLGSDE